MKLNALLATIGMTLACQTTNFAAEMRMVVKENKVSCYGNNNDCYLIKTGRGLDWTSLSSDIKGFNYEVGYRYHLIVDKTLVKGTTNEYEYKLIKLLKQEAMAAPPHPSFEQINGKKWFLTYFKEQDVANEGITMEFFPKRIALKGLCNNYFAYYTVSDKVINSGRTAGTMKACAIDSELENTFIKSFDNKNLRYEMNDNFLLLYNGNIHIMTFADKLEQRELDNMVKYDWKLYQYDSTLLTDKKIITRLSFDKESKKINGTDGCNNFFGPFEMVKNTITFGPIGTTMKACMDTKTNLVSAHFNKLFNTKNVTYELKDNRLYFYQGEKTLMIFSKMDKVTKP